MESISQTYLTRRQLLEKFGFLTENMLKNILSKDMDGFRGKVVRKLGRRLLFSQEAFLIFLAAQAERKEAMHL